MKFTTGLFCLLVFLIFSRCKDDKSYTREEASIDSLETLLMQSESSLQADTSVLRKRAEKIAFEMSAVKLRHTDMIPASLAYKLDDYKKIRKVYVSYMQNLAPLNEETGALRKQLVNLRTSLLKGKVSDDNFQRFYQIEKNDVMTHHARVLDLSERVHLMDSLYNHTYPEIETVVQRLLSTETK